MHLYQLANDYKQLATLQDNEDIPDEVIRDTLESLTGEIQAKAVNVVKFTRNLESTADAIEEAAKAMQARANRIRRRTDAIREYLLRNMIATDITKIECDEFVIAVRDNPPAVKFVNETDIPARFMVQQPVPPPKPDKTAIKKAIQAGEAVAGCWLEQGKSLRITI